MYMHNNHVPTIKDCIRCMARVLNYMIHCICIIHFKVFHIKKFNVLIIIGYYGLNSYVANLGLQLLDASIPLFQIDEWSLKMTQEWKNVTGSGTIVWSCPLHL